MSTPLIPPVEQPEPKPLLPEMEKPAPYPLWALGEVLGGAAEAIVRAVQVPDSLAAQSVLAAAAMASQPHGNVQCSGQLIPLSLYALTVAESGDRKSTVDRLALQEHQNHQRELMMVYKADAKEYRDKQDAYQKARAHVLNTVKGDPDSVAEELGKLLAPNAPVLPFILSEEPTIEGLEKSLLWGQPSQGLFSDEGGQFFGGYSTKSENKLKCFSWLSKRWDGAPINRNRAAEGETSNRYGCRLSLHLMTQPVVAADVLSDSLAREQGFLARFLIAWPESLAGTRFYQAVDPKSDSKLTKYWGRMARLLAKEPLKDEHGDLTPHVLILKPDALEVWVAEYNAIEVQLGRSGDMFDIKATAAKGAENILRIAGVLAVVEEHQTISANLVKQAAELMRWYLAEALRLTGQTAISAQLLQAQRLLDWLSSKSWREFDARTLQKDGPPFVRKSAKARDALLGILVEQRWLSTTDGKTFRLSRHATTATTATIEIGQSPESCDTIATPCDNVLTVQSPSQRVADTSQTLNLSSPGVVAGVASVAVPERFGGEV
jgi:hypothetical protein